MPATRRPGAGQDFLGQFAQGCFIDDEDAFVGATRAPRRPPGNAAVARRAGHGKVGREGAARPACSPRNAARPVRSTRLRQSQVCPATGFLGGEERSNYAALRVPDRCRHRCRALSRWRNCSADGTDQGPRGIDSPTRTASISTRAYSLHGVDAVGRQVHHWGWCSAVLGYRRWASLVRRDPTVTARRAAHWQRHHRPARRGRPAPAPPGPCG